MTWMPRMLAHRTRAQGTLLLAVVGVTVVAATLLGTFALLLSVGGDRAPQVALERAEPDATTIDVRSTVGTNDPELVTTALQAGLAELLGPIDAEIRTWTSSAWLQVDLGPGVPSPLVYLADYPILPEQATLLSGQWPTTAWDGTRRARRGPSVTPQDTYEWSLGDLLATKGTDVGASIPVRVAATYRADPPRSAWTRDLLSGRGHVSGFPVPGSTGGSPAEAWGPPWWRRARRRHARHAAPRGAPRPRHGHPRRARRATPAAQHRADRPVRRGAGGQHRRDDVAEPHARHDRREPGRDARRRGRRGSHAAGRRRDGPAARGASARRAPLRRADAAHGARSVARPAASGSPGSRRSGSPPWPRSSRRGSPAWSIAV